MPFRPIHNAVVIRPNAPEEKAGSLFVPESAQQQRGHGAGRGTVVSCGEGHAYFTRNAARQDKPTERVRMDHLLPLDVKPGDDVVFSRAAAQYETIDGEELAIVAEGHIMAVIEKDNALEP